MQNHSTTQKKRRGKLRTGTAAPRAGIGLPWLFLPFWLRQRFDWHARHGRKKAVATERGGRVLTNPD
jgi:hypothetical protein